LSKTADAVCTLTDVYTRDDAEVGAFAIVEVFYFNPIPPGSLDTLGS
jgi:hypothetical protein